MSEKHLPWQVVRAQHGLFVCEGNLCVANLGDGATAGQQERAALIAAAPDLLEALKYARRFVNASEVDIAFIDRAIAKATEPA